MIEILQGTTPTFTIEIPEEISVSGITALELSLANGSGLIIKRLADVNLDANANAITYHFTEAETLSLNPHIPLTYQIRFEAQGEIYGTKKARINVDDLMSQEAIR